MAVAQYATEALAVPQARELDRMRRYRHKIEYGTTSFSPHQVEHDLGHARVIVAEVAGIIAPG